MDKMDAMATRMTHPWVVTWKMVYREQFRYAGKAYFDTESAAQRYISEVLETNRHVRDIKLTYDGVDKDAD